LLALAEVAEPMQVLPAELEFGAPGLAQRIERTESEWFAAMRADLSGSVPSADLVDMVAAAGYEVIDARTERVSFDAPLPEAARQLVWGRCSRMRHQLEGFLDQEDLRSLDVLCDVNDARGVLHRADVFVVASQRIVIARPLTAT
jgi:hypothetical protein